MKFHIYLSSIPFRIFSLFLDQILRNDEAFGLVFICFTHRIPKKCLCAFIYRESADTQRALICLIECFFVRSFLVPSRAQNSISTRSIELKIGKFQTKYHHHSFRERNTTIVIVFFIINYFIGH